MTQVIKKYGAEGAVTKKWEQLILRWQESDLSQSAFCRENQLKPSTFSWWVRKLRTQSELPSSSVTSFVQITRQAPSRNSMTMSDFASPTHLALSFSGMELKFSDQLNPVKLNDFLLAIRSL